MDIKTNDQFCIRNFSESGYYNVDDGWTSDAGEATLFNRSTVELMADNLQKIASFPQQIEIMDATIKLFNFYIDSPITTGDEIKWPADDEDTYEVESIENPDGVMREYLAFIGDDDFDPVVTIKNDYAKLEVPLSETDMNYLLNMDYLNAKAEKVALEMVVDHQAHHEATTLMI